MELKCSEPLKLLKIVQQSRVTLELIMLMRSIVAERTERNTTVQKVEAFSKLSSVLQTLKIQRLAISVVPVLELLVVVAISILQSAQVPPLPKQETFLREAISATQVVLRLEAILLLRRRATVRHRAFRNYYYGRITQGPERCLRLSIVQGRQERHSNRKVAVRSSTFMA